MDSSDLPHEYKDILTLSPLVRTLSSHHWEAAKIEMARCKLKFINAGMCNGLYNTWEYEISRDQVTRKGKPVLVIKKISILNGCEVITQYDRLPVVTRCKYIIKGTVNKTGKKSTRPPRQCKNKSFEEYCTFHNRMLQEQCTYIV